MLETELRRAHEMPFGTQIRNHGVEFRIWAPTAKTIELIVHGEAGERTIPLERAHRGWCSVFVPGVTAGTRYQYRVDNDLRVPDPASRMQDDDVHGASVVVDPRSHKWQDTRWRGRPWHETVLYELHVGTFTPEGTFNAVVDKLDYLVELGVTAVELMPVADFPGKRNWGYDGVLLFAPDRRYGTPDELKNLVQECHRRGLMIFLDVVYNHFGPEGNYLHCYAKKFFNPNHQTPWGDGINFDAEDNDVVRSFFIANAVYWLNEFNFDGLRFDAVHAMKDDSDRLFLTQLAQELRQSVDKDRQIHLVVENDDNIASLLARDEQGSPQRFTAQWNDDYHHCMHVGLTGESSGYYADYAGGVDKTTALLLRVLSEGFAHQGEPSPYRNNEKRGEPSSHLPPLSFVNFLQNHDQIGNRAFGDRLAAMCDQDQVKAALTLLLLAPQIPMLYMGEEWGAKTPFLFFCDLGEDLAPLVTKGRRDEFAKFKEFSDPAVRERIPDPSAEQTYRSSILNWQDKSSGSHAEIVALTARLLKLRRERVVPLLKDFKSDVRVSNKTLSEGAFFIEWTNARGHALRCAANLTAHKVNADVSMLAQQPDVAVGDVSKSELAPWTVAWWTQHAN